jgi:nucleoside-diphosphate-sugar epimerase
VDALVHDNIAFPTRLIEALVQASSPMPFVNVGTAWQHVDGQRYRPKNLYAATKQAFEDVLTHYVVSSGIPTVTVNLFDTYGPGDHRGKLVQALIAAARSSEPLPMSSGTQLIDLVEVTDVVRALRLAAAQAGEPMPVFAASSGSPLRLRDLVAVLDEVLPAPVPVLWGARPDRDGEMLEPWDAGPPVPGWVPQLSLREGFRRLLERSAGTTGPA